MSGNLVVLDVGKTLSKLSLWTPNGELLELRERRNQGCYSRGLPVLDTNGIEEWLAEALASLPEKDRIGGIIPVGHGAGAALIRDGARAAPPADYEAPVASQVRNAYDAERDPFTETGSPALPDGLNLGVQLHHLEQTRPELFDPRTQIVTWPQYWSWLLSGVAATEGTSLGCHTDLWNPAAAGPSKMAIRRGWAKLFAPLSPAGKALGRLRRDWAARTGLPPSVKVYCGLHDSSAALVAAGAYRELGSGELTVLSTGTWFVAMRSPGASGVFSQRQLPEGRDVLLNVDPELRPVPSARFMGGREIHLLTALASRQIDIVADQRAIVSAAAEVLSRGTMVLPTLAPGCGPFPKGRGGWIAKPNEPLQLRAAASLYAALMTDEMLDLIGSRKKLLVEGRFAAAELFVRALATFRPDLQIYTSSANADVARGALKLVHSWKPVEGQLSPVRPLDLDLRRYRARWRVESERLEVLA